MSIFKKGDKVKLDSNKIDSYRTTDLFEEEIIVERNKSSYGRLQNIQNFSDNVTLIFKVKGKYKIEKHGISIGGWGIKCRIDILRERIIKI